MITNGPTPSGRKWFTIHNAKRDDEPTEILIYDQIGKDWWSDTGVAADEFANALNKIPRNQDIGVWINSPGGNVFDGMAIYNRLAARRDKVVCHIDGVAASIASVIALAGRELHMPRNAMLMIHRASGMCMGTVDDMEDMIRRLNAIEENIAGVYERKTGRSTKEIQAAMTAETWFNADQAKEWGFADTIVDDMVSLSACANWDLSGFRRVPDLLNNGTIRAGHAGGASDRRTQDMNRKAILALLRKHGVKIDDSANDAQLMDAIGQLESQPDVGKDVRDQLEVARGGLQPATPPAPAQPALQNAAPTQLPSVQTPAQSISPEQFQALERHMQSVNAQLTAERRTNVERHVDTAIQNCQIPVGQRQQWVDRIVTDASMLEILNGLPQREPGAQPVSVEFQGTSIQDIVKHFTALNAPMNSWMQGRGASRHDVHNAALLKASHYRKHREQLLPIMNTNTIDSDLQRQTILQEMMGAFAPMLLPVRAFSTVFVNVPLEGTDEVVVPYFDLQTAASTDWNPANGYVMGDTSAGKRKVTVNKRKYQALTFSSDELRRQPFVNWVELGIKNAQKLAVDVFQDILSVVTLANFGAAAHTGPAGAFDSDDIADLRAEANLNEWPMIGRSLFVDSAYDAALVKDPSIKHALNYGGSEAIRQGQIPVLLGFDYYWNANIPDNAQNLTGFISHTSAILVATAPIQPTDDVRSQLTSYELVIDPQTGIAFEFRQWGDPNFDTSKRIVECNYGYAAGNADALKRITSA